jgi:DNA-binding FrmR family transcriptional regulator
VPHTVREKAKIKNRVRRIRGQIDAIERALDEERDCEEIMQLLASCRGALGSLTAEIIEGHIRWHIAEPKNTKERVKAGQELVDVLKTYLR